MAIGGKIIGGLVGSMFGPLGTILGVAIGHSFDKSGRGAGRPEPGMYRNHPGADMNQTRQMTFFAAVFSLLGKLAASDGQVSGSERAITERFIREDLKFHPEDGAFAMRIFDTAAASSEPFEKFAEQFAECFRGEPQMTELLMDILVRVAYADDTLDSREDQFIARTAMILNYPAYSVTMLRNKYGAGRRQEQGYRQAAGPMSGASASLMEAYSVLGCNEQDSDDAVRARYKKLVKEYHPDVIASKGLPEEFTEFANKKFAQIQEAYDKIKKYRGI